MKLEPHDIDQLATAYREDFTPNVEHGLRQLHGRLKPASQMHALPRRRLFAIAAVGLLVLVAAVVLLTRDTRTYLINDTTALAEYALPDGTTLTLQRGSSLSYDATTYNLDARRLTLDGQAYFEVVADKGRPFIVSNGTAALEVTGTAFNLRAREEVMEVEVSEGTVMLQHENGDALPVAAMECALAKPGVPMEHRPAPHLNHHAWRTGVLQFDHTPIEEVLTYLSDNWGIECEWENGRVCSYNVSGSYRGGDAGAVLRDIAKLGGVEVRSTGSDDKHYLLKGSCSQ